MALEQELETYKAKWAELTNEEGKFILIKGSEVVGLYGTYEDALQEGYAKFKLEPFLVKQISVMERIQFVSRFVQPVLPLR